MDAGGARPATEAEVLDRLGPAAAMPLLLCGHTHLQRRMRLPTGALVVNARTVGWAAAAGIAEVNGRPDVARALRTGRV